MVVNTEARDLGLGSGGFDIVHVNLTPRPRAADGAEGDARDEAQLHVAPAPGRAGRDRRPGEAGPGAEAAAGLCSRCTATWRRPRGRRPRPGPVCGSASCRPPAGRCRGRSRATCAELRERGLLCGHVTAGPAYGGEHEAISLIGGARRRGRRGSAGRRSSCGPGPGILGSATRLGHGGMAALDSAARGARARACRPCSPRGISSSDPRPRHRGLSHHTATVLELLLGAVRVAGARDRARGLAAPASGRSGGRIGRASLDDLIGLHGRHDLAVEPVDLDGYAASGLPARTMGRTIAEDPLFFAAPLAAGAALAAAAGGEGEPMERIRSRTVYEGEIATVRVEEFRYPDGATAEREVDRPPRGRRDGRPRRAIRCTWCASRARRSARRPCWSSRPGSSTSTASPRSTAHSASSRRRSGKAASSWRELKRFYIEPGIRRGGGDGLPRHRPRADASAESDEEERIEIVRWPLADLDAAIAECRGRRSR